jgi:DNA repair exonuclease SbcCD ATPase subunit
MMASVERYVSTELAILAECGNAAVTKANPQRLAVFKNGWSMIAQHLTSEVGTFVERLLAEYDAMVADLERRMKQSSIEQERKRIESEYSNAFERMKTDQQALWNKRERQLKQAEEALAQRKKQLEEKSKDILTENERLKRQHDEDHDRAATLSHAVIDARLIAQRAETAQAEAEKKQRRIQQADMAKLDLMDDVVAMSALLKKHGIPFEMKTRYVLDVA